MSQLYSSSSNMYQLYSSLSARTRMVLNGLKRFEDRSPLEKKTALEAIHNTICNCRYNWDTRKYIQRHFKVTTNAVFQNWRREALSCTTPPGCVYRVSMSREFDSTLRPSSKFTHPHLMPLRKPTDQLHHKDYDAHKASADSNLKQMAYIYDLPDIKERQATLDMSKLSIVINMLGEPKVNSLDVKKRLVKELLEEELLAEEKVHEQETTLISMRNCQAKLDDELSKTVEFCNFRDAQIGMIDIIGRISDHNTLLKTSSTPMTISSIGVMCSSILITSPFHRQVLLKLLRRWTSCFQSVRGRCSKFSKIW